MTTADKLRDLAPHLSRTDAALLRDAADEMERTAMQLEVARTLARKQLAADLARAKFNEESV